MGTEVNMNGDNCLHLAYFRIAVLGGCAHFKETKGGIVVDIFRISSQYRINMRYWSFCGDDYGYNLFKDKKPKEVAINIIRQVFNGQNIDNMQFAYKPFYYRGSNSLQDRIEVYYRIKQSYESKRIVRQGS